NGCFDAPDSFNLQNIFLTDIDGSGTTDIVYTGNNRFQVWFNQSGNSLADPFEFFNPFPELSNSANLSFVDLLGSGTSCIVWSSMLPGNRTAPLRYIDMMNGIKPHILSSYKNNRGKEVTLVFRSSTAYYLDDKKMGKKWVTKLPFPVQCVSKLIVEDKVSQTRFANEYSYHHGYYDAREREFRGFAMVEQRDTETYTNFIEQTQLSGAQNTVEKDLYQPAVFTKTWFHTGAYFHLDRMFHFLQDEYYPTAQVKSGQIADPSIIAALQNYTLPENPAPTGLSGEEYYQFCRSLKGLPLRQETYSDEGVSAVRIHPYTVSQSNYEVQLLQPMAGQPYASFFSHEKENLAFNFERNPLDPRIAHSINVSIDSFGNILESSSIVYGRQKTDPTLPTDADRAKQTAQYITYALNRFTTLIDTDASYRLPLPCETQGWELNATPAANQFYRPAEIAGYFAGATVKLYEQATSPGEKRKINHARTYFQKNDLTGSAPFGTMESLALPFENYLLAFTPTLIQNIYGGKVDDNLLRNKALYVRSEGDTNYWIRSGKTWFHPDLTANPNITSIPPATMADVNFAKSNFYMPVAFEDNFGNLTKIFYDVYKLLISRRIDPLQNELNVDAFNYRIPAAYIIRDANNNRTAVRFDALGRVIRTFIMGKESESRGDPIDTSSLELSTNDQPTTMFEYDFRYQTNNKLPDLVKLSARQSHYFVEPQPADPPGGLMAWLGNLFGKTADAAPVTNPNPAWLQSYSYSDGSGHEILTKVQAEPGPAPLRDAGGKLVLDSFGRIQEADTSPALRWVGRGKIIYANKKDRPVKRYEPYFDSSFEFNDEAELTLLGYPSVLYYDAPGRVIKIQHANGSFSKTEFDAWTQYKYDENDTVIDGSWYTDRIGGALGPDQQQAAQQSALHYNTPTITFVDSLARTFLTVGHNKTQRNGEAVLEEFYYSRVDLDIQGNAISATDPRGNVVMTWEYDMLGNICYQNSMDAGERWMLSDVMCKTLRLWDSRQQVFSYVYDNMHRPLQLLVNTG
ncbi:MAG TPA: toxin TcdB middle/N-terminal domain-containing protein, partial [Puia sp.]|nr:toxin TcdB middle/N-terminal domain-containing protein [Puia sp.]